MNHMTQIESLIKPHPAAPEGGVWIEGYDKVCSSGLARRLEHVLNRQGYAAKLVEFHRLQGELFATSEQSGGDEVQSVNCAMKLTYLLNEAGIIPIILKNSITAMADNPGLAEALTEHRIYCRAEPLAKRITIQSHNRDQDEIQVLEIHRNDCNAAVNAILSELEHQGVLPNGYVGLSESGARRPRAVEVARNALAIAAG